MFCPGIHVHVNIDSCMCVNIDTQAALVDSHLYEVLQSTAEHHTLTLSGKGLFTLTEIGSKLVF